MKISATVAAAASLCIGLAASSGFADDALHPALAPQGSAAPTTAAGTGAQANCLLPGRLRDFRGIAMVAPRRAVTLDADACATRGGTPIDGISATD